MSEQDPLQQQAPALANIRPIGESEGQPLTNYEDIQRLVEGPAVPAVTELWDKNVGTVSSSANSENGAYIDVDWKSLSDENKLIARDHGLVDESEPEPRVIKLSIDTKKKTTVDEVAVGLQEAASIFKPQELSWAKSYTVDEMKALYGYSTDEEFNPANVQEYYFAPDGKFHLSKELYQKSLFSKESSAEEVKDPEVKLSEGQMRNFNQYLHGPVDNGQALEAAHIAERQMDQAATSDKVDPEAGRVAVIAATLGSLTRSPALLHGHMNNLAGRLHREFAMDHQDVTMITTMMHGFSQTHGNINRAADVIYAGMSYLRGQEAQGKDVSLLAVAFRAGVVGAVKDFDLRASVMRDLAGNKPVQ